MRINPTIFSDWTFSHLSVTGSSVYGPHGAVLIGGESGVGGFTEDGGEVAQDAEAYGAPGIVFRPRPPEEVVTPDGTQLIGAEAMAARTPDGLVPVAWRDLRFNRALRDPKPGTVALVGYGGGFLAFEDGEVKTPDPAQPKRKFSASVGTLVIPYDYNASGQAARAHSIVLDPDNKFIGITHGKGHSVRLRDDGSITLSTFLDADPDSYSIFLRVSPDEGLLCETPWGRLSFGPDGFHVRHSSGARIDLGAIGGMPAPLDALASYVTISAAIASIEASAVSQGTDAGLTNSTAVGALITLLGAMATAIDAKSGTPSTTVAAVAAATAALTNIGKVV